MSKHSISIYFTLLLWGCLGQISAAPNHADKLAKVQAAIESLSEEVEDNRERYQTLQQGLQSTESSIADLAESLQKLNQVLPQKQQDLEKLRQAWQEKQAQVKTEQDYLSKQVRAAYIMGRQDYLKILLNQEDPTMIGRVLTYYDYFNRARAAQIERYQQHLEQLDTLKAEVSAETRKVSQLLQDTQAQKQQLQDSYRMRQQVLMALSETIENQDFNLYNLKTDKAELQQLLGQLPTEVIKVPARVPFAQLKRHLPHPVMGEIRHSFGEKRGIGKLKWQGLFFQTEEGNNVRSVADGEIVFADWFRNFGYLVIIKHDSQYMSLYGHNRNLYKKVGDSVLQGDVIAQVGKSGGQKHAGLYFELRKQGKAFDPKRWLDS